MYVDKNGTVEDLLNEAKKEVKSHVVTLCYTVLLYYTLSPYLDHFQ